MIGLLLEWSISATPARKFIATAFIEKAVVNARAPYEVAHAPLSA
jgi:hypothetical protein